MIKASFFPHHLFSSPNQDDELPKQDGSPKEEDCQKALDKRSRSPVISREDEEDEDVVPINHIVNKPPEKRQRAPSAYNNFIKEEIRRLKAEYPNMTHKEAFSAAAKNVSFLMSKDNGDFFEKMTKPRLEILDNIIPIQGKLTSSWTCHENL
ncbi:hypothetical protein TEA_022096 [Camellia sinensis var. sinensis]|uniref:YABBY protein C-terminal domain-containing protein n=2 Tax=Camellia sinensis TaxID=4442 RepID=A0A4S4D8T8_CAMSN|nr:hypothetical protein TEA_022096 [Camellia sinensis var. sinensis]